MYLKTMKKFYKYILIILFIPFLLPAEESKTFSPLASFPSKNDGVYCVKSVASVSPNIIVQIGSTSEQIPEAQALKSNGEYFCSWQLPIEREFFNDETTLQAGCAADNQVCLLLNNRLDFFTPDGEYIRRVELTPSFSSLELADVCDMAYDSAAETYHFLLKDENEEKVKWLTFTSAGNKLSTGLMPEKLINANSLFLIETSEEVLLGAFAENNIVFYYQNGEPVEPADSKTIYLLSPARVQTAANNCMEKLSEIYFTNIPKIIDITLSEKSLWFQTDKYLIHFDEDGKILNIPLLCSFQPYDLNYTAYTDKLPNNQTLWSAFSDRYFIADGFGKNPRAYFWSETLGENMSVVDFCVDKLTNWWMLCINEESESPEVKIIKKSVNGKIETVQRNYNDEPPFSFIKTVDGPLAVAGRYYCSPVNEIAGENFSKPWLHNLNLTISEYTAEVINGAATTNGAIFMCVRETSSDSPWLSSRDTTYIFDYNGNTLENVDFNAGFIKPRDEESVLAFAENEAVYSLGKPPYIFLNYIADINYNNKENFCGFNYFPPNLFVFPTILQTISYYTPQYYSKKKEKPAVLIKPNKKNIAVYYEPATKSLYIIGQNWKNKFLSGNPLGTLLKLGQKVKKNPEKTYKKLTKKKSKNKAKIKKITVWLDRFQNDVDNLFVYAGVKQIKLVNGSLKNITSEYGDQKIPLGILSIAGSCSGNISCSQIKKLSIRNTFSGNLKTWFGSAGNVEIGGKCENAQIFSRRNINKVQINNEMKNTVLRAGINPLGFIGYSGDIKSVWVSDNIDSSEIIACADEGESPGWSGNSKNDNEHFYGSVLSVSGRVLQRGGRTTFLSKAIDSLFVSRTALKSFHLQAENSEIIINGELK